MATDKDGLTREERLAAKLRENLKRRKAQAKDQAKDQARVMSGQTGDGKGAALPKGPEGG